MSPQVFFGLLLAALLAAVVFAFEDELFSLLTPDNQVELARHLGATTAAPRPDD
jgi:Na+-driven multidrug efflux pump